MSNPLEEMGLGPKDVVAFHLGDIVRLRVDDIEPDWAQVTAQIHRNNGWTYEITYPGNTRHAVEAELITTEPGIEPGGDEFEGENDIMVEL